MARRDEISRIGKRLRNIAQFLDALELAIAAFGPDRLAGAEFADAFGSGDPDDINRVVPVMSDYEHTIQDVVEAGRGALRITGRIEGRRPRAEDVIDRLAEVGAITKKAGARLHEHYVFRGRLSHNSPDVSADELALYTERALAEVPAMATGIRRWAEGEGVSFGA